jgi:hypothetical protein
MDKKLKEFNMAKGSLFCGALGMALVFAFFLGSCSFIINGDNDSFVAVTDITGVPTTAVAGISLTLTGTVTPSNATNKTIVWTVKDAETTGAVISGNSLITVTAGTVTVTAMVVNGSTVSSPYIKDFPIAVSASDPVYVPVTGITGVPTIAIMNSPLTLRGTVEPAAATNKTIVWSGTGVSGGVLTASSTAIYMVTATIENGKTESSPYTETFTITAYDAGGGGGSSPFGSDGTPFYWAPDDSGGGGYVKITDDSWEALGDDGICYASGTYSRIGDRAAHWTITGGGGIGDTGLAYIKDDGTMLVANLADNFSGANGTLTKLDTTLALEGTWKTDGPTNNGTYMKIVASAGNFIIYISLNGSNWRELMKGTYQQNTNPVTYTVTAANTAEPGSGESWTLWEDLTEAEKTSLGLSSKTAMSIIYTDRCETKGQIFYKQP